jgi:hypothetical protein
MTIQHVSGPDLLRAAAARATVHTIDERVGTIVYAPNPYHSDMGGPPVRHGDRTKCGVVFGNRHKNRPQGVRPDDIVLVDWGDR